ncbi:MAG: hypothetical protein PF518_14780 [Spirochaetaceae bacterium]|nr:hypothetical protein [Spirochaetaceae bacterium]
MKLITTVLLSSILLFSCSMKQEIFLKKEGSGTASIEIRLKSFVIPTIEDLAEVSPDIDPDDLLSPEKITESLLKNPEVSNVNAVRPLKHVIKIDMDFGKIENLFEQTEDEIKSSGLIEIEDLGDSKKLTLTVNKDTYRGFSSIIPNIDDPTMSALAPDPDMEISEGEYLDMIEFFFGDDGPAGILDSMMDIIIKVDGTVTDQRGGEKLNKSTVEFKIPLIRILLLDKNLVYSVTYN